MTLTATEKTDFSTAYLQFLVKTWTDEGFAAKAEGNPREALAEAGLELPADATVELIKHEDGAEDIYAEGLDNKAAMEAQVALFEKGKESGHYRFHVPGTPNLDTEDLNAVELSDVAGGFEPCCCCCCC